MSKHSKGLTEAKATQWLAIISLFPIALIVDAFALYILYGLIYRNPESYNALLIACIIISLLGFMLTLAFPVFVFKKLREPSLRLYLPESKPECGEVLKGQIVISMPASQAPPIVATLKLTLLSANSIEFSDHGSVVWEKEVTIDIFKPAGVKQCKGEFEISLRDKALTDFGNTDSFRWQLFVRSADPKKTFGEVFDVPSLLGSDS